jgi:branched-chain amino acid transport system substrate-binding protein
LGLKINPFEMNGICLTFFLSEICYELIKEPLKLGSFNHMKFLRFFFAAILALFLLGSCIPKPIIKDIPATYGLASELLEKGDQQFKAGKYDEAIRTYNELIFKFPDTPEAAMAMMKNGLIHKELQKYSDARRFFEGLVARQPRSRLGNEARIEILETYLSEKNYQQTIKQASKLFERSHQGTYPTRVYLIVGDAYLKSGKPENAVKLYAAALKTASESEKDPILETIKSGIGQIPSESLESLLETMDDIFPKGYIMYQLGLNQFEAGSRSEALSTFIDFINKFPTHKEVPQAKNWIDTIQQQTDKGHYSIGVLLPLSGKYEELGQKAWTGIEFAIAQFGSIYKTPGVSAVIRDSGSDREQTARATAELASEQVAAIIGPMINAEVAAEEAQIQKVPIITLTLADKITEYGDYVFRNFLTPQMQIKSMVSLLVNSMGIKRFAILYPKEKYGTTHMNLFWDEVVLQGGVVVGSEPYDVTITDFKGPIKKLSGLFNDISDNLLTQRLENFISTYEQYGTYYTPNGSGKPLADFGAIFIPDSPVKVGMIIPQLSYYDISGAYLLGTNLWHSENFIRLVGDYSQKAILTDGFFAGSNNPRVRSFVNEFQATYGQAPGFIEAVAYDTAMLLMEVLAQNNILYRTQLKDALTQVTNFPGITGNTSFDQTGEAQKGAYVLCIKNKRFVELKRP